MANSRSSGHARLHKAHRRGHSASAVPVTVEESWSDAPAPSMVAPTPSSASHPLKIKPYLRKLSSRDPNGLDLSRPAAENESLAGLGVAAEYPRSVSDVTFAPVNGRHRHTRSTSSTSQFSSSSGLQRPTPLSPIRQTPQPYTPPISRSTPPSLLESENDGEDIMAEEEFRQRQIAYDGARRSGSLSSVPGVSLRINTNNSSTRLAGSYSQSSLSLTSPVLPARSRGDTLKSIDTTSPSSRTSFDQTYRFVRGGRDSPIDAASRAASIRAARQKFEEDERAKELKHEKAAHKQAERDFRKQLKRDEYQRRQSEAQEKNEYKRSRSISDSRHDQMQTPRPSVGGRQYSDHKAAHSNSLPKYVATVDPEKQGGVVPVTKSRAAKGRWLRFVTWFKTRLLRISRKVGK